MTANNSQNTLARITEGTEKEIARLYQIYSEKFPEFADFWNGLVLEQIDHINIIHGIMNQVSMGLLECNEDRLDCMALEILQSKVQQEITRANKGQVSPVEAFYTALEIERAVSKREYSEAFKEDLGKVKEAFTRLASNAEKRIKWIEKHLQSKEG